MLTKRCSKLIALLFVLAIALSIVQPAYADDSLHVYYLGPDSGVKTALELAKFTLVDDPSQADVLVLNGEIPVNKTIHDRIEQGVGLVLILGPKLSEEQVSELLGIPLVLLPHKDAASLTSLDVNDPLVKEIIWNGAPQVRERFEVQTSLSSVQPLVTAYEDGEWILWAATPHKYIINAFLNESNPQIQEWAYFNYMIYHLVERASGRTPLSFANYPASPVPHTTERNILFALMGLIIIITFGTFFFVRRYSQNHPDILDQIVSDRTKFAVREEATGWENIGFHRPLSGFLVAFTTGIILFSPLIIY